MTIDTTGIVNTPTPAHSASRLPRRLIRVSACTFAFLAAYLLSALIGRLMFERGIIQTDSPTSKFLEAIYRPLDGFAQICPPFQQGFDWCVNRFPPPSCKRP